MISKNKFSIISICCIVGLTLIMNFYNATAEGRSTVQILHENNSRVFEILDACKDKRGVNLIRPLAEALVDEMSGKVVKVYQYPPHLFDRNPKTCIGKCADGFEPTILMSESETLLLLSCIKISIENK